MSGSKKGEIQMSDRRSRRGRGDVSGGGGVDGWTKGVEGSMSVRKGRAWSSML